MFFKEVDKRNRKEMESFLENHFRYNTMNSWNRSTSYANNLKIHSLGLSREIVDKLYEFIYLPEFYEEINFLIEDWNAENNYYWQARFNGKSGGYLVLYQGEIKDSEYKSFCRKCGQKNFKVAEEGAVCGVCKNPRTNYTNPPKSINVFPGRSTDQDEDFSEWDMQSLKERVSLIQSFDRLCDAIVETAIFLANSYNVVEEEILVPQTKKVLVAREG